MVVFLQHHDPGTRRTGRVDVSMFEQFENLINDVKRGHRHAEFVVILFVNFGSIGRHFVEIF